MRALVQRVSRAAVRVDGEQIAAIGPGLLVLLGIRDGDGDTEADRLAAKVQALRVFEDAEGRMNEPLGERELLCVSQFTLYGDTRKGNRPSYLEAAAPQVAEPLSRAVLRARRRATRGVRRPDGGRAGQRRPGHGDGRGMSGSAQTAVRRIEGDHNELRFEVEIAGGRREIWFRTEAPITARADPAVAAVLLPAMRAGSPLRFDDPIDPLLIRRVPDLVELLASWRWLWKHLGYGVPQRIEVEAPAAGAVAQSQGGAEAAFFSGGVDSFFTVLEVPEVSRLIYVTGLDTRVDDPGAPAIRAAVGEAAERLGKPLITVGDEHPPARRPVWSAT